MQGRRSSFDFADSDISWRHCGRDADGGVVLFYLADLEERTEKAEPDKYMETHLKKLKANLRE